ncbi:MAG: GNAT family N-acetyltransferase [Desulfobacterales bacterium]
MGIDSYQLHLSAEADPKAVAELEQKILRHNQARIGAYRYTPLVITARDPSGGLGGVLQGHTGLEWLYIELLWIVEDLRRQGLGERLLNAAETEAQHRGCRNSYLYTYSFQTPGFYTRRGYQCCCRLEAFPAGHEKLLLKKSLNLSTDKLGA